MPKLPLLVLGFALPAWGETPSYTRPSSDQLKKSLSPLQYEVTQKGDTEKPFENAYWDNKREGIYVDIVTGEPLFSSLDKYDSGTGWPTFSKPIEGAELTQKSDRKFLMERTEIRSKGGDSHLGHVFDDGPGGSDRYCVNSAALRFVPREDLAKEGYGAFEALFQKAGKKTSQSKGSAVTLASADAADSAKISLSAAAMASAPIQKAGGVKEVVLAGGCFWCLEAAYDQTKGVESAVSGYIGGKVKNPSYEQVSTGKSGHLEAVRVRYDPKQLSFEKVLSIYWDEIDPTDDGGQFVDRGEQYRTAIYVADDAERKAAEASKAALSKKLGKPVVTRILPSTVFYEAEGYHQDYADKNPGRYNTYKNNSGRPSKSK